MWRDSCRDLARAIAEPETGARGGDRRFGDLGIFDMLDQADAAMIEFCILFEELGRTAYRGALLESLTGRLAARDLGRRGSEGNLMLLLQAGGVVATEAGPTLHGYWYDVADVGGVEHLAFRVGAGVAVVEASEPGVRLTSRTGIDGASTVTVAVDVPLAGPHDRRLLGSAASALARAEQLQRILRAAEMVGGASEVIERAVAYTREREVFGRPIARFQAVQHALATAELHRWVAWLAVYEAAAAGCLDELDTQPAKSARAVFAAGRAYLLATTTAAHVIAGIGHIDGHWLPAYYARAKALDLRSGGGDGRALDCLAAAGGVPDGE